MKKLFFIFLFFSFLFLIPFISSYNCTDLVSYYPLDEYDSRVVYDHKGENNGIVIGYEENEGYPGVFNSAFDPAGSGLSGGIILNDSSFYVEKNTSFSFVTWIKLTQTSNTGQYMLFGRTTDMITHTTRGWSIFNIAGNIFLQMTGGAGYGNDEIQVSLASTPMTEGLKWYHLAVTYNGNGSAYGVSIYIDGVKQTLDIGTDTLSTYINRPDFNFSLSTDSDHSNTDYFAPKLDDVYIFSKELNASEVLAMNNSANPYFIDRRCNILQNIPNQNLDYNSSTILNLKDYFAGFYDLAVISTDPFNSNRTGIITGYYNNMAPFYYDALETNGSLGIASFYMNYTDNIDVFSCWNVSGGIDDFCPVLSFPLSCNFSAFYTADSCVLSSFNLSVSGNYSIPVTENNPFSLYYRLDDFEQQTFIFSNYFNNFNQIEVKYIDRNLSTSTNQTLTCNIGEIETTTRNGFYNITFGCEEYNSNLTIKSNNLTGNYTFNIKASNSNNSLIAWFIVSTGNISGVNIENEVWSKYFNFSSLKSMFPVVESETHSYIIGLIVVIAFFVIGVLFIGVPLKFSGFAVVMIALLTLFSLFFMAYVGYIPFLLFIIPLVLLIVYIIIKFIYRGGLNGGF